MLTGCTALLQREPVHAVYQLNAGFLRCSKFVVETGKNSLGQFRLVTSLVWLSSTLP